jgi:PST family polysaccharide transporter
VLAVYVQAGAAWLSVVASGFVVRSREHLPYPTRRDAQREILRSNSFFWLRAGQLLYGETIPLILAYLSTAEQLAYFGVAEKSLLMIASLMNPISQAILPFISRHVANRGVVPWKIVLTFLLVTTSASAVICSMIAYNAEFVIDLVFGRQFAGCAPALRIFCATGPLVVVSMVIGYFVLIPLHRERYLVVSSLIGGVVSIVISVALVPSMGAAGAAFARLGPEAIIAVMLGILFIRVSREQANRPT